MPAADWHELRSLGCRPNLVGGRSGVAGDARVRGVLGLEIAAGAAVGIAGGSCRVRAGVRGAGAFGPSGGGGSAADGSAPGVGDCHRSGSRGGVDGLVARVQFLLAGAEGMAAGGWPVPAVQAVAVREGRAGGDGEVRLLREGHSVRGWAVREERGERIKTAKRRSRFGGGHTRGSTVWRGAGARASAGDADEGRPSGCKADALRGYWRGHGGSVDQEAQGQVYRD